MKITLKDVIYLSVIAVCLIFALSKGCSQKIEDKKEAQHEALVEKVEVKDKNFDSALVFKNASDKVYKHVSDSTTKVVNSLVVLTSRLRGQIAESQTTIAKLTSKQKADTLSKLVAKDTVKAIEDIVEATKKDSLITK